MAASCTNTRIEKAHNSPTGTPTHLDEVDLAATRQSVHSNGSKQALKATLIDDAFAIFSALALIADVVTDILVSLKYFVDGEYEWFGITISCVLASSLAMQIFSVYWFREDEEKLGIFGYLLHCLQLGPLQRYWKAFINGIRSRRPDAPSTYYEVFVSEWRDITMLRLFEAFIEAAPQLVLQLYILAHNKHFDKENDLLTVISACCSLISLSWSIVAYSKALRDSRQDRGQLAWCGFIMQILWRLCMVGSRVVAMVMFASEHPLWLFVLIAVHWVVMTAWLMFQKTAFCVTTDTDGETETNLTLEKLFNVIIGFVYIFCFFNTTPGTTRQRIVIFYAILFVENTVMICVWYPHRHLYGDIAIPALVVVWGGFTMGIVCMVLYYRFYHPSLMVQGIFIKTINFKFDPDHKHTLICCCWQIVQEQEPSFEGETIRREKLEHYPVLESEIVPRASITRRHSSTKNRPSYKVYFRGVSGGGESMCEHCQSKPDENGVNSQGQKQLSPSSSCSAPSLVNGTVDNLLPQQLEHSNSRAVSPSFLDDGFERDNIHDNQSGFDDFHSNCNSRTSHNSDQVYTVGWCMQNLPYNDSIFWTGKDALICNTEFGKCQQFGLTNFKNLKTIFHQYDNPKLGLEMQSYVDNIVAKYISRNTNLTSL